MRRARRDGEIEDDLIPCSESVGATGSRTSIGFSVQQLISSLNTRTNIDILADDRRRAIACACE